MSALNSFAVPTRDAVPPSLLLTAMPGRETIAAGVWVNRGAAHDPHELAGASHLVEHLMLRACGDLDRRSLASRIDRLGGEVDAWTSSELMGISINTTLDGLRDALDLLVNAVLEPTFAADDVELERRVTLAELALAADDPVERVEEGLLEAAWGEHPLARPVIGTRRTLASLGPEQLRRHHAGMVRNGSMVAAVVGDVPHRASVDGLARLPLSEPPRALALPELVFRGRHLTLHRDGQDQVHVRLAFEAPAVGDRRIPALLILNRLLGDGASSRLFQRLREDAGLTYDIWSGPLLRRQGGLLEVGWACSNEQFPDSWRLVLETLDRAAHDISGDEIEVARQGLLCGLQMDLESPAGWCALDVGEVLERGRRFDPQRACREVGSVTLEEVRALAVDVLRPDRMASAVCGPEGVASRVGR